MRVIIVCDCDLITLPSLPTKQSAAWKESVGQRSVDRPASSRAVRQICMVDRVRKMMEDTKYVDGG